MTPTQIREAYVSLNRIIDLKRGLEFLHEGVKQRPFVVIQTNIRYEVSLDSPIVTKLLQELLEAEQATLKALGVEYEEEMKYDAS